MPDNAISMSLDASATRQLGAEGLFILWRDGREPGRREGLACSLSIFPHPECASQLVHSDAQVAGRCAWPHLAPSYALSREPYTTPGSEVPIDIPAVAVSDDPDDEDILLGRINDAVVAGPYPIVVLLSPQLLEANDFRERINAQDLQDLIDADSDRLRESLIFPEG